MKRIPTSATTNVTSIVLAALAFGLVAGFPIGYLARHIHAETTSSNLPYLQNDGSIKS